VESKYSDFTALGESDLVWRLPSKTDWLLPLASCQVGVGAAHLSLPNVCLQLRTCNCLKVCWYCCRVTYVTAEKNSIGMGSLSPHCYISLLALEGRCLVDTVGSTQSIMHNNIGYQWGNGPFGIFEKAKRRLTPTMNKIVFYDSSANSNP